MLGKFVTIPGAAWPVDSRLQMSRYWPAEPADTRPGAAHGALPSREALRAYATTLRGVLDDLPFGVIVVEADGRVTLWNDEFDALVPRDDPRAPQRALPDVVAALGRIVVDADEFERGLGAALADPDNARDLELALPDGGALSVSVVAARDAAGARIICLRDSTGELRARRELEHRALHDPLTKLPNRELLLDRLTVALARRVRQDTAVGVIFIDLDNFKNVNDEYGHAVGDELLVSVAQRLVREVRDGDTVARFGGDEFVVLCEDLTNRQAVAPLASRLGAAIAQPVAAGGRLLTVSASIGIVVEADPGIDPETLLARADADMYRHKRRSGRAHADGHHS